ncbi:hypothetical protein PAMP_016461 [Pampus punctatissimus]
MSFSKTLKLKATNIHTLTCELAGRRYSTKGNVLVIRPKQRKGDRVAQREQRVSFSWLIWTRYFELASIRPAEVSLSKTLNFTPDLNALPIES